MSLLTPDRLTQLKINGQTPDADHLPVAYLKTMFNGQVIGGFMMTHV